MTVPSINAGGDFRVGEVLSRAWSVFTRNIIFFLAVPLVVHAIYFLINEALGRTFVVFRRPLSPPIVPTAPGTVLPSVWLIVLVSIVTVILFLCLYNFGQGVLLTGAFQRLRGEPLRVGVALQRAWARLLPLIALSILIPLAMFGVALACFALIWVLALALGGLAAVLSFLIFVPIFILGVMWSVVVPACLVEGLGPIESMARSADLTKGYRWRVTGIMLLLGLIALAVVIVLGILFYAMGSTTLLLLLVQHRVIVLIVQTIVVVVWTGYIDCVIIMIYHDLRVAKEGVDTSQIAAVFD
jgi:hypothetical protein